MDVELADAQSGSATCAQNSLSVSLPSAPCFALFERIGLALMRFRDSERHTTGSGPLP